MKIICLMCGGEVDTTNTAAEMLGVYYHQQACTPEPGALQAAVSAINGTMSRKGQRTAEDARRQYEENLILIQKAEGRRQETRRMQAAGSWMPASFWHGGRVYSGSATRQPDGTWSFVGTQHRQFSGRNSAELTVTGMRKFNPNFRGKHTVEATGGVAKVS